MLYDETKKLAAAGVTPNRPGLTHQTEQTDMPAFLTHNILFQNKKADFPAF